MIDVRKLSEPELDWWDVYDASPEDAEFFAHARNTLQEQLRLIRDLWEEVRWLNETVRRNPPNDLESRKTAYLSQYTGWER